MKVNRSQITISGIIMKNTIIHWVRYASQPNVLIECNCYWCFVWDDINQKNLPDNVYLADNPEKGKPGYLYTFDRSKITCPDCIKKINDRIQNGEKLI